MSIKLGKYSFQGPYLSIDKIKDSLGIYAVVCEVDNEFFLLDVGDISKLRKGIENNDPKKCWMKNNKGKLIFYIHRTIFLKQRGKDLIEQELRELYQPVCGRD